ncbi:hypothetical protein PIB30_094148 [Stylosanthes scabra]|uniref:Uncharacterized protein n=1 Tax=Stylosanthes scabra TaxID=79078 RepID=A0ABU6YUW9_9FABA|nr:hypothetical protein [Stylosanthes scabra]
MRNHRCSRILNGRQVLLRVKSGKGRMKWRKTYRKGREDVTKKEWEEVKSQGLRLENERKELESNKQLLKSSQLEIHEDSEMLMNLRRKVKNERELLVAEINHFLSFVEMIKCCQECGEVVGGFVVSDLQLPEYKERSIIPSPTSAVLNGMPIKNSREKVAASNLDTSGSGSRGLSCILRKSNPIRNLSPNKRTDGIGTSDMAETVPLSDLNVAIEKVPGLESLPNIEGAQVTLVEQQLADGAHHSLETPQLQSENIVRHVDSQQLVPKRSRGRPLKKSKSGIARTRSVKVVVREANEFLGRGDSSRIDKAVGKTGRKPQRVKTYRIPESEQNSGDSDGAQVTLEEQQLADGAHHSLETQQLQSENIVRHVDSQQSIPKRSRGRPPKKSKSVIARTRSVKAVVRKAKTVASVAMLDFSSGTNGLPKEVASSKTELDKAPEFDPDASLVAEGNTQPFQRSTH